LKKSAIDHALDPLPQIAFTLQPNVLGRNADRETAALRACQKRANARA
jgi:hypothetical protein